MARLSIPNSAAQLEHGSFTSTHTRCQNTTPSLHGTCTNPAPIHPTSNGAAPGVACAQTSCHRDNNRNSSWDSSAISAGGQEKTPHDWLGTDDKDHPHNWPLWQKLTTTIMLAAITFVASLNSAMFAPAVDQVSIEFGVSKRVATLGTSLFMLGFCLGPPFWGPLSEKFGRKTPLLIGSGGCALFSLMPALGRSLGVVLVGRFLSGAFGAGPATIVGGMATDNWGPAGRTINLTLTIGTIFGAPGVAPTIGGFIAKGTTWRWIMWVMFISGTAVTAFCALAMRETYAPEILKQRAKRLRKSTGDDGIFCKFDNEKTSISVICHVYLVRPWVLFLTEPILILVTIYQAFIYGILYLFLSAYPIAFGKYRHWLQGLDGLPLLSIHVGIFLAVALTVLYVRHYLAPKVSISSNPAVPEDRLPMMIFGAIIFPVGLFWYAWTSTKLDIHWMVPTAAGVLIGCGMFSVFIQCIVYLIEVYLPIANSAMASNGMVRSLFGAGFPLFATSMYERLGVAWASSLLAFIAIAMIPIPVLFFVFGAKIRSFSKGAISLESEK